VKERSFFENMWFNMSVDTPRRLRRWLRNPNIEFLRGLREDATTIRYNVTVDIPRRIRRQFRRWKRIWNKLAFDHGKYRKDIKFLKELGIIE